jgi:hypothetical protein
MLTAGRRVSVSVKITNRGAAAANFFVDPRLNTAATVTLAPLNPPASGLSLPLVGVPPLYLVPALTSSVSVAASASLPIMFDYNAATGSPDLASSASGTGPLCSATPSSSYTAPGGSVTSGVWFVTPAECGPYATSAPAGTVSVTMTAQTRKFDPAVRSNIGDFWRAAVNPATPFGVLVIQPGQTKTIRVSITPSGPSGTVVSGHLYVDEFLADVPPYGQTTGDEIAALPYSYTIK